jgi:beta-phosphoglucomutase-like phosphatase (HAD superfamily)
MDGKNYPLGVIFDLDGTLIDSESLHKGLYQKMAARIGVQLTDEEYYAEAIGMTDSETLEYLFTKSGRRLDLLERNNLIQDKQSEFLKALQERSIPAVAGAVSFIKEPIA